jgi:hypothetical protein
MSTTTKHTPVYAIADVRGTVKLVSRTGNPLIELKPASSEGGAQYDALVRLIAQAPAMLSLCRDIVLTWDDETPRAVVSKARAILRSIEGDSHA